MRSEYWDFSPPKEMLHCKNNPKSILCIHIFKMYFLKRLYTKLCLCIHCYSMSQLPAFGVWLYAVVAVFPWNKLLSALAEQLFSGVMHVAKVPVHFVVILFRRKEKQSQATWICQPQIFYLLLFFGFSCVFRVTFILTTVSADWRLQLNCVKSFGLLISM